MEPKLTQIFFEGLPYLFMIAMPAFAWLGLEIVFPKNTNRPEKDKPGRSSKKSEKGLYTKVYSAPRNS